jgi:hypothetical protein
MGNIYLLQSLALKLAEVEQLINGASVAGREPVADKQLRAIRVMVMNA